MIKSIHLQNFQSHKDTSLVLSPKVTAIVGATDSGKSAIFRALYWLAMNRPSGDAFRSHWGGDTKVSVVLDTDDLIERTKGEGTNEYRTNAKVYKAFGADVPEQVRALLRMDELNFQSQFSLPFLLGDTPADVARKLNEVAGLELIDVAQTNASRGEREAKLEKVRAGADLSAAELDVARLEKVVAPLVTMAKALKTAVAQADNELEKVKSLEGLIESLDELQTPLLKNANRIVNLLEQARAINRLRLEHDKLCRSIDRLSDAITGLTYIESEQRSAAAKYDSLRKSVPKVCPECGRPL